MAVSIIPSILPDSPYGYLKCPDGTLIQWGRVIVKTTRSCARYYAYEGDTTITFPMDFYVPDAETSNISYAAFARIAEGPGWWGESVTALSNTQMQVFVHGDKKNADKNLMWMAFGRWKE